jgi:hypothetical protein
MRRSLAGSVVISEGHPRDNRLFAQRQLTDLNGREVNLDVAVNNERPPSLAGERLIKFLFGVKG